MQFKLPTLSDHTKHMLALGAAALLIGGATWAVLAKQGQTDLGVNPATLGSGGGFGGSGLRSLLANLGLGGQGAGGLGLGSGTDGTTGTDGSTFAGFDLPQPPADNFTSDPSLPSLDQFTTGDTGSYASNAPAPASTAIDTTNASQGTMFPAPAPADTYISTSGIDQNTGWYQPPGSVVYEGTSQALAYVPPTPDNSAVYILAPGVGPNADFGYVQLQPGDPLPAPTYTSTGVISGADIAAGHYIDPQGNYQVVTNSTPTGVGLIANPDNTFTVQPLSTSDGWNPGWGHDPNNPQDTN